MRPHLHEHGRDAETVPRTRAGIKRTRADQTRALPKEGKGLQELPGGGRWDGAVPSRPPVVCLLRLQEATSVSWDSATTFTF